MNAPAEEAEAHAKVSKRENRLYVGNLAYDCNYKDLEKFMSGGGSRISLDGCLDDGCSRWIGWDACWGNWRRGQRGEDGVGVQGGTG